MTTMTREEFESLLDAGQLQTSSTKGGAVKWYDCHRNGPTKIWKPTERMQGRTGFTINIKYGDNNTMRITNAEFFSGVVDLWFRERPPRKA